MNSGPPSSATATASNDPSSGVGGAAVAGGGNNNNNDADEDEDAGGKEQGLVTVLNANDVIFGRGAPTIDNEGNMRFRQMVHSRRAEYLACSRRQEKDWIARQVMTAIKNRGGRFLRKVDTTTLAGTTTGGSSSQQPPLDAIPQGRSVWSHVDEEAVLLKVKQAMRDRSLVDEEPRPRRRRRVRSSNNVVLDDEEQQSIEEEKRAAQRPRVEAGSASQQQQPLLPPVPPSLQLQQIQSQEQQQRANLVELLLQQPQQLQGQEETRLLAELQRQQHERSSLAQSIEEQRLRNSLQDALQRGALGGIGTSLLTGLRDIPSSLVGGTVTGTTAPTNMSGLSDITTLARLYPLTQQGNPLASSFQPALNMASGAGTGDPAALFGTNLPVSSAAAYLLSNLEGPRLPLASNISASLSAGPHGDRKGEESHQASHAAAAAALAAASLGGHTGQAYGPTAAATTAAMAAPRRSSLAASSQASSTGQQQEPTMRLKPGFRRDSPQPSNDESLRSTSGELAIEQAFNRMKNDPVGALQEQYLKLSLIEGCLLAVVCSVGIPHWTTGDMSDMFIPSTSLPLTSHTANFTWFDLLNLLKEKLNKLKNGNTSDGDLSALASTAVSNPRLMSGAAVLSIALTKDPPELARMTIMLLEKIRIHSRIEQQTQDSENFLHSSNALTRSSRGHQTGGDGRDSDDYHGSTPTTDKDYSAASSPLLWQHLLAELGRWATSLNVEDEGTGRPIAHSMFDLTPCDLAEEEVVAPVAALDMMSACKILDQTACPSRLRAIFQGQSGEEDIADALKHIATTPTMNWASRPSWWLYSHDIWLLENVARHGFDAILDVPTSSSLFPVSLRDAGLTKAVIKDRAVQLTIALHEQIQERKRVQVEQERSNKLSAMMSGTKSSGGTSASA